MHVTRSFCVSLINFPISSLLPTPEIRTCVRWGLWRAWVAQWHESLSPGHWIWFFKVPLWRWGPQWAVKSEMGRAQSQSTLSGFFTKSLFRNLDRPVIWMNWEGICLVHSSSCSYCLTLCHWLLMVNDVRFVISEDLTLGPGTRLDHSRAFV